MRSKEMTDAEFKTYFEKKVRQTIRKHKLFTPKDRIGVAISGGKDSTVCLYLLKKLGYDVEAVMIDVAVGEYSDKNIENAKRLCKKNGVNLQIFSFEKELGKTLPELLNTAKKKGINYSSCMMCGIFKRYILNKYARKLKFDYIATGHNLDDEAQAFLMNIFRNDYPKATKQGASPGISKTKKFVKRAKPLFGMTESEIIRYSKLKKFPVFYGICPLSSKAYRRNFINFLDEFEKTQPDIKYNIIKFMERFTQDAREKAGKGEAGICKTCGEPASKEICKTCEILEKVLR